MPPSPLAPRLARLLSGVALLFFPIAFFPGFHEEFRSSKTLVLAACLLPAAAVAAFARRGTPDPIANYRRLFVVAASVLSLWSFLRDPGTGVLVAPWLVIAVTPILFLDVGTAFGGSALESRRLLWLLALGSVPVLVIGLVRRLAGWPSALPDRPDVGLAATIGNSNELAEYAAPLAVALVVAGPLVGTKASLRRLAPLLAVPALILVALSDSRGGWLATAVGLAVATPFALARRGRFPGASGGPAMVLGLVLAGVLAVAVLPGAAGLRTRLATIVDPAHPTNQVRLGVWGGTADLISDHWVAGVGAGRYAASFAPYRRSAEWILSGAETTVDSPHQEALWLWAEGGLAGVLVLGIAVFLTFRILRAGRDPADPATRLLAAGAIGAVAATATLTLVRSPFHHPSGVLVPATLLGALAASSPGATRFGRFGIASFAIALVAALLAIRDVREDRAIGDARWSLADASEAVQAQDLEKSKHHFRRARRALATAESAGFGLAPGPWTASRAYRAALVAHEMATLRNALSARGIEDVDTWLVDEAEVRRLVERCLALAPGHRPALVLRSELDLEGVNELSRQGRYAEARERLADAAASLKKAIDAQPSAPGLRVALARVLALDRRATDARRLVQAERALYEAPPLELAVALGKLALRLGTEPETFGLYLEAPAEPPRSADKDLGLAALAATDTTTAFLHLLAHLGRVPADHEALYALTQAGYARTTRDPDANDLANRAVARSRLLMALDADAKGDQDGCQLHLKLALTKDEELLDAWFLKARLAARAADAPAAVNALKTIRKGRVAGTDLRLRVERDPAFADLLRLGQLDPALVDS